METQVTLRAGSKGTKRLVERYGERLICVRYRYDAALKKRYKTVELIIEEVPWGAGQPSVGSAPGRPPVMVGVRVAFAETELRRAVKDAGGRWDPARKLWIIPLGVARRMGLQERLVAVPDSAAARRTPDSGGESGRHR